MSHSKSRFAHSLEANWQYPGKQVGQQGPLAGLDVGSNGHAWLELEAAGHPVHLELINGRARFVEDCRAIALGGDRSTLRILPAAEAIGADEADCPHSHAVLDERESVELDRDLLSGPDVTGVGRGDARFHLERRIGRHQRISGSPDCITEPTETLATLRTTAS